MSDRRTIPANERVVWDGFAGPVPGDLRKVAGEPVAIAAAAVPLLDRPGGRRERELVLGEGFRRLDTVGDWAFGFAERDGYVGWIAGRLLAPASVPTHVVAVRESYLIPTPDLKTSAAPERLSFAARLVVGDRDRAGRWAEVLMPGATPRRVHVPVRHLRAVGEVEADPVAVALRFLGTPYVWGGNTGWGIDCSGLVQAALLACGIACPGDSDLQQAAFAEPGRGGPIEPGELVFWPGHVAMAIDADRLIHANATDMAVALEPFRAAVARIEAAGDGPLTGRGRPMAPR